MKTVKSDLVVLGKGVVKFVVLVLVVTSTSNRGYCSYWCLCLWCWKSVMVTAMLVRVVWRGVVVFKVMAVVKVVSVFRD